MSGTLDDLAPKGFVDGTHRLFDPAETLRRVGPHMERMGITRLANVTGLDTIRIPVVMAVRPNSRALAVSQGKGMTLDAAKSSALMESVETWHAERIDRPLRLASLKEMEGRHRVADVKLLRPGERGRLDPATPILWIEAVDLLTDEGVWVPYDLVHTRYTTEALPGQGWFDTDTSGLASGNHILEAASHAIAEVVERDAWSRWMDLDSEAIRGTRVDLATVDDPACRTALDLYAAADVGVAVWKLEARGRMPCFHCLIVDRSSDDVRPLYSAEGCGAHPDPGIALLRALTEAAQSRLTAISGSRDDFVRADYERLTDPEMIARHRVLIAEGRGPAGFLPEEGFARPAFREDVEEELARLKGSGIDRVLLVDLSIPGLDTAVVRVLIPGLQAPSRGERIRARTGDGGVA